MCTWLISAAWLQDARDEADATLVQLESSKQREVELQDSLRAAHVRLDAL